MPIQSQRKRLVLACSTTGVMLDSDIFGARPDYCKSFEASPEGYRVGLHRHGRSLQGCGVHTDLQSRKTEFSLYGQPNGDDWSPLIWSVWDNRWLPIKSL